MRGGRARPTAAIVPPLAQIVLALLLLLLLLLQTTCAATPDSRCSAGGTMATSADDVRAELLATVRKLVKPGKGVLAADESTAPAGKRVRLLLLALGSLCVVGG